MNTRRLFNFEALWCGVHWTMVRKRENSHLKIRRLTHLKF